MRLKVTGINEDQLLVTVLPGLPTTAEIFIVPEKRSRTEAVDEKWAHLDQVSSRWNVLTAPGRCSVPYRDYSCRKVSWGSRETVSGENIPGESALYFRMSHNSFELSVWALRSCYNGNTCNSVWTLPSLEGYISFWSVYQAKVCEMWGRQLYSDIINHIFYCIFMHIVIFPCLTYSSYHSPEIKVSFS